MGSEAKDRNGVKGRQWGRELNVFFSPSLVLVEVSLTKEKDMTDKRRNGRNKRKEKTFITAAHFHPAPSTRCPCP